MNANENYGNPNAQFLDYRSQYSKAQKMGITKSSFFNNITFNGIYGGGARFLRSPSRAYYDHIGLIYGTGSLTHTTMGLSNGGFSPCFCLGISGNASDENRVSLGLGEVASEDANSEMAGSVMSDPGLSGEPVVVKESDDSKEQVSETLAVDQVAVEEVGSKGSVAVGYDPMLPDVGTDAATGGVSALAVAGLAFGAFRRRLRGQHEKV